MGPAKQGPSMVTHRRRKRNPLGLRVAAPTVNNNEIQRRALTEPQCQRMIDWFNEQWQSSALNEEVLEKICDLGHGNGGVVSKVRDRRSNTVMARKLVHLEVKAAVRNQILKEMEVLQRCNSPYIVGYYGTFSDENDISICMEYMDGLSLDIMLKKVGRIKEEPIIGRITTAVVRGLMYLKDELRILHRDVKPPNILVNTNGEIKLCDFGVSGKLVDGVATNSFVGTRTYMAPERLTGSRYSVESDVWSFGLSLIEMAVGRFPVPALTRQEYATLFNVPESEIELADGREVSSSAQAPVTASSMSVFDLLEYIVTEPPPTLPTGHFTPEFVDFVTNCTKKSPTERANLKTLAVHPFFMKYADADDDEFANWVKHVISL